MASSLGPSWRSSFKDLNPVPCAAASIRQVHHIVLTTSASQTGQPARIAVKVQFPNISRERSERPELHLYIADGGTDSPVVFSSIRRLLFHFPVILHSVRGRLMGMRQIMKEELADECDYIREAACLRSLGSMERHGGDPRVRVP